MSNVGKWDEFYKDLKEPDHYIDTVSYYQGADFLVGCDTVEDWGCGKGWFQKVAQGKSYQVVGVDGSQTPFADKIADLTKYTTEVDGIFMRHVAEHNYEWKKVLQNLFDSFTKKAFVAFYTPMNTTSDEAVLMNHSAGWDDVPEISLPVSVIEDMLQASGVKEYKSTTSKSSCAYGEETLYFLEK